MSERSEPRRVATPNPKAERIAAKAVDGLRRQLEPGDEFLFCVLARFYAGVGTDDMARAEGGVFAASTKNFHYYVPKRFSYEHISFAHADIEGIERTEFRFDDGFADGFVFDLEGGETVAVVEDDETADYVAEKLDKILGRTP